MGQSPPPYGWNRNILLSQLMGALAAGGCSCRLYDMVRPSWELWGPPEYDYSHEVSSWLKCCLAKQRNHFICTIVIQVTSLSVTVSEVVAQRVRSLSKRQDQTTLKNCNETWSLLSKAAYKNWYYYVLDKEIAWTALFLRSAREEKKQKKNSWKLLHEPSH